MQPYLSDVPPPHDEARARPQRICNNRAAALRGSLNAETLTSADSSSSGSEPGGTPRSASVLSERHHGATTHRSSQSTGAGSLSDSLGDTPEEYDDAVLLPGAIGLS